MDLPEGWKTPEMVAKAHWDKWHYSQAEHLFKHKSTFEDTMLVEDGVGKAHSGMSKKHLQDFIKHNKLGLKDGKVANIQQGGPNKGVKRSQGDRRTFVKANETILSLLKDQLANVDGGMWWHSHADDSPRKPVTKKRGVPQAVDIYRFKHLNDGETVEVLLHGGEVYQDIGEHIYPYYGTFDKETGDIRGDGEGGKPLIYDTEEDEWGMVADPLHNYQGALTISGQRAFSGQRDWEDYNFKPASIKVNPFVSPTPPPTPPTTEEEEEEEPPEEEEEEPPEEGFEPRDITLMGVEFLLSGEDLVKGSVANILDNNFQWLGKVMSFNGSADADTWDITWRKKIKERILEIFAEDDISLEDIEEQHPEWELAPDAEEKKAKEEEEAKKAQKKAEDKARAEAWELKREKKEEEMAQARLKFATDYKEWFNLPSVEDKRKQFKPEYVYKKMGHMGLDPYSANRSLLGSLHEFAEHMDWASLSEAERLRIMDSLEKDRRFRQGFPSGTQYAKEYEENKKMVVRAIPYEINKGRPTHEKRLWGGKDPEHKPPKPKFKYIEDDRYYSSGGYRLVKGKMVYVEAEMEEYFKIYRDPKTGQFPEQTVGRGTKGKWGYGHYDKMFGDPASYHAYVISQGYDLAYLASQGYEPPEGAQKPSVMEYGHPVV
jgi:hypothetical protein